MELAGRTALITNPASEAVVSPLGETGRLFDGVDILVNNAGGGHWPPHFPQPGWEAKLAAMSPEEREQAGEPIPMDAVADAVLNLVTDDALNHQVVVL